MFACSYGAAFGAIQQIPQIVPGVPEVKAEDRGEAVPQQKPTRGRDSANVGKVQEFGGLVGRFLLAVSGGADRQPAVVVAGFPDPGPDPRAAGVCARTDDTG